MPKPAAALCFNKVAFTAANGGFCTNTAFAGGDYVGFCGAECYNKAERLLGEPVMPQLQTMITDKYSNDDDEKVKEFRRGVMTVLHGVYSTAEKAELARLVRWFKQDYMPEYMSQFSITSRPMAEIDYDFTGYHATPYTAAQAIVMVDSKFSFQKQHQVLSFVR
jgi:hypothetical protein